MEFIFTITNSHFYVIIEQFSNFFDKALEARANFALSKLYPNSVIKTHEYFIYPEKIPVSAFDFNVRYNIKIIMDKADGTLSDIFLNNQISNTQLLSWVK